MFLLYRICDDEYVCLSGIGQNPNNGLTSFDNFGSAMMLNFQIISLDMWDSVYNRVSIKLYKNQKIYLI
jgi:hypothetical protein